MGIFTAELIGTMLLILLGDGVVGGVVLKDTKSNNAGWIVITLGWGLAVAIGAYSVGRISGAHLNPAVTLGFAWIGKTPWNQVFTYISGQFLGALIGAVLVYLHYLPHWAKTEDKDTKLGVFCCAPAIRNPISNFISEGIGTFVLVFGILAITASENNIVSGLSPLLVGFLVVSIGLSLGGVTGYAINPARDLAPRIAHFLLPIPNKRDSDWGYSWIPILGPLVGGILGATAYDILF
jgi:glycerol uptake facilitator protein